MARFLGGLNEEISGFVEMFPYRTLQDLVDQAMHIERKIQQESRGKSYGSHSIAAPWRKQHSSMSLGGGRSQGAAARPSPSIANSKMAAWRLPQRHRLQINSGLLQIQQPQPLPQVPLLLLEAEKLYAISVTAMGTLLPNVQAVGPCC